MSEMTVKYIIGAVVIVLVIVIVLGSVFSSDIFKWFKAFLPDFSENSTLILPDENCPFVVGVLKDNHFQFCEDDKCEKRFLSQLKYLDYKVIIETTNKNFEVGKVGVGKLEIYSPYIDSIENMKFKLSHPVLPDVYYMRMLNGAYTSPRDRNKICRESAINPVDECKIFVGQFSGEDVVKDFEFCINSACSSSNIKNDRGVLYVPDKKGVHAPILGNIVDGRVVISSSFAERERYDETVKKYPSFKLDFPLFHEISLLNGAQVQKSNILCNSRGSIGFKKGDYLYKTYGWKNAGSDAWTSTESLIKYAAGERYFIYVNKFYFDIKHIWDIQQKRELNSGEKAWVWVE